MKYLLKLYCAKLSTKKYIRLSVTIVYNNRFSTFHFTLNQNTILSSVLIPPYNENYSIIFKGVISVTKSPDREVISQIKLTVIAKDNPISVEHRNTQKTSSMTITVYFDDENDNSPTFARNYTPTVEEDKPVGSLIVQVSATDIDQGNTNNSKISYYIEDITERQKNKFSIDELTGEIKINSSLVDCVGSYPIKVVAYDYGNPQRNGSTMVNVTVTDKNRHPPVIGNLLNGNEIKIYEVNT